MPIYKGSTELTEVFKGTTEIISAYKGSTLVYDSVWTPEKLFKAGDAGDWFDFQDTTKLWTGENLTGSNPSASGTQVKSCEGQINGEVLTGGASDPVWTQLSTANNLYGISLNGYPGGSRITRWKTAAGVLDYTKPATIIEVCRGGVSTSVSETSMGWLEDVSGSTNILEHRVKGSRNRPQCLLENSGGSTGTINGGGGGTVLSTNFVSIIESDTHTSGLMKQYYTGTGYDAVQASSTSVSSGTESANLKLCHSFGYGNSTRTSAWNVFHVIYIDRLLTSDERQKVSDWGAALLGVTP